MELKKIEIENYKSIKSPVTIAFSEELPMVLIGKNGSGKTNVLETLEAIASANSGWPRMPKEQPIYRAYIQLSKEDVENILTDIEYDKSKCEIVAYSKDGDLKINRIESEYIVPSLKKEIVDIRDLVSQLKKALDTYDEQFQKISRDEHGEPSGFCHNLEKANGGLTNYRNLYCRVKSFIDSTCKTLDEMLKKFDDDESILNLIERSYTFWREKSIAFSLEYVEPSLAPFEQKFITIDSVAIKKEIEKINEATKKSCEQIDKLVKVINEKVENVQKVLDDDFMKFRTREEQYDTFLQRVRHIIGRNCSFLKNENHDVIFKKEYRDYNHYSHLIMKTYLMHVYDGSDRDELLKSSRNELTLSKQSVADFEAFLNKNIPSFDREMYDSISVHAEEKGRFSIFLNEKTGKQINLNETSAGRRWYFTYYFMKSTLSAGDIFIIDEPAAMLHPTAQREVLRDLMELTKRGVKVVYSTHSPYLIPDEWQCVHFVTMTADGTKVNSVSSNQELVFQMTEIVGNNIFDISNTIDKYNNADTKKVTENVYNLVVDTQKERGIKSKQLVCDEIGLIGINNVDTLDGWKAPCMHRISLDYLLKVLKWTKKKFDDVL